jgi:hypothetical protein
MGDRGQSPILLRTHQTRCPWRENIAPEVPTGGRSHRRCGNQSPAQNGPDDARRPPPQGAWAGRRQDRIIQIGLGQRIAKGCGQRADHIGAPTRQPQRQIAQRDLHIVQISGGAPCLSPPRARFVEGFQATAMATSHPRARTGHSVSNPGRTCPSTTDPIVAARSRQTRGRSGACHRLSR